MRVSVAIGDVARAWALLRVLFGRHELKATTRSDMTAPQPAPVLVNQPTAAPTRKWSFDAVAQVLTVALSVVVMVVGDIGVTEDDVTQLVGAVAAITVVVGKVVGYFTRDRTNA